MDVRMDRIKKQVRNILLVVLLVFVLPLGVRGEDGYDLWLRYPRIENDALRRSYLKAITGSVVSMGNRLALVLCAAGAADGLVWINRRAHC